MKHDLLKLEVERIIGHRLTSANEFEQLSHLLLSHTHERLSPTTLKRLWGYLKNEEVETRRHTLDVLSRFVGFGCYEDFCAHLERLEEQHCRWRTPCWTDIWQWPHIQPGVFCMSKFAYLCSLNRWCGFILQKAAILLIKKLQMRNIIINFTASKYEKNGKYGDYKERRPKNHSAT